MKGQKSVPKKTYRKAKRQIANRKKRAAKKNMDTFFLRTRVMGTIVPSQGATVANYIASFWQLLDPTSVVGVTQSSEFGLFKNIYDRVRVNRMTIKITPKANVLDQVNAQNEDVVNVSGDGKIHTVILREQDGYTRSVPRLQRQPSYRGYSVLKGFTRKYQISYPTGVWLDCQNIYNDETLLKRLGAYGGVGIYAENILEENLELFNEPWAQVEITYDCVFQGKVVSALSLDQNTGAVTVAKPTFDTGGFSQIVAISGTFQDTRVTGFDASGGIVEVSRTDSDAP